MALITLGEKPQIKKTNKIIKTGDLSPEEIRDVVKNMDKDTRNKFLDFLIFKVKEEKEQVTKAFCSFKEVLDKSVVCKDAKTIRHDTIIETFDVIIKVLESDFAGLLDYQIEVLKAERKVLIKDLSLAYYNDFNRHINKIS